MLVVLVLFLIFQVPLSIAQSGKEMAEHPYGREPPSNGKLIHDMRTFVTVTFDWSSRLYSANGVAIPPCHERRLRRTFYEGSREMLNIAISWTYTVDRGVETGHIMYPMVITVVNGSAPRQVYFAVAVHKVYAQEDLYQVPYSPMPEEQKNLKLIDLVVVSKSTWTAVWDLWSAAELNGMDLCYGGRHFDNIIPLINRDSHYKPQLDDLVGNFTDVTSDVCGPVRCGEPHNETETLTFAIPTEEGLEHLVHSPYVKGYTPHGALTHFRFTSNLRIGDCIADYYRHKRTGEFSKREEDARLAMIATQCVFYEPFC